MNRTKHRAKLSSTPAKLILAAVSLCSTLALGAQTAAAQAIVVTTAAFSAGNQSYPAGTYQFTRLSDWSLSIRNVNGGGEKFFAVRPIENGSLGSHGSLTFRNSEDQRNLDAVYVPGTDTTVELLQHNLRNKKARSATSVASAGMSSEKVTAGNQNARGR